MLSYTYRVRPIEHLDILPHSSLKEPCLTLLDLLPTLIGDHLYEAFREQQSIWRFFRTLSHSISVPFSFAPWIDQVNFHPPPGLSTSMSPQKSSWCFYLDANTYQAHLFNQKVKGNQLLILFACQERFIPPQGRKLHWNKKIALDLCLRWFESSLSLPHQTCFLVSDYWDLKLMEKYRDRFSSQARKQRILIPTLLHGGLLTPMSYL